MLGREAPPKNDAEKIVLLRSLLDNGYIADSFDTIQFERKAYEYLYLTKMRVCD